MACCYLFVLDLVCDATSDCSNGWDEDTYTCCSDGAPGQVQCGDDVGRCVPFGKGKMQKNMNHVTTTTKFFRYREYY